MRKHLTDSVVEHQLKQQQKISQLQDENKELKQTSEEHQLKQQQMISQLQDENKELKQRLVENEWLNSGEWNWCGPESSPLMILSNCGRALLRVNSKQLQGHYESKPFLAHHSGYMARIKVDFSSGIITKAKPNHLLVYLSISQGNYDNKLTWPFKIRHTITLVDQQGGGQNISKTTEPDKFDGILADYCFRHPRFPAIYSPELNLIRVEQAMLCVPLEILSTRSYTKNNTIIVKVEVDN